MIHIVYDLEFTVMNRRQYVAEIIEIGAVKLSIDNGEMTVQDLFQTFVKPTKSMVLHASTMSFTNITQEDVYRAPTFRTAIDMFRGWMQESAATDMYLWSWGMDDRYQLIRQCHDENIPLHWIRNYNDLQRQFSKLHIEEGYRQIGLTKALESLGLEFEGMHHRAIHDAFNTAKIFLRHHRDLVLEKNVATKEDLFASRLVYQTGELEHRPFANLAAMLERN